MKILITGGTGNVAECLVKQLERDHDLVLFDRVRPGEGRTPFVSNHQFVEGDLTSEADCARAVAGCAAVMHLGAIPFPTEQAEYIAETLKTGQTPIPPDETMRVNTLGTYSLMRASVAAGVKTVVAITSNCVLGHGFRTSGRPFPFEYLPVDEEHPRDPEDSYSVSKYFQSEIMHAFSRASGIHCYGLRPAGVWRPERMKEWAVSVKPVAAWTDWLYGYNHIEDVARAMRLCLEASSHLPPFDVFYLNADDTTALEDSLDIVRRFRPDLLDKVRDLPGRSSFISNAKAGRDFGWRPRYSWTTQRTS
ncbi:MAG TPA: NAD(P)-dependent oxidoreductase [Chloroflexota bacterium]|nr:NAD(P)-dependent oxidoreductase [Chloroflexota bacterium]